MPKLINLINQYGWPEIENILFAIYPDQSTNAREYQEVYSRLKVLSPIPTNMRIVIEKTRDELSGASYDNLYGKNGELVRDHQPHPYPESVKDHGEISWALDFTDWAQWLAMEIDPQTLANYSEPEVIAHCLYEMTFYSYHEERIREIRDSILSSPSENENKE